MEFQCKRCGKCCNLNVIVTLDDINRWITEQRFDILSCLTWLEIPKKPIPLLFIPKKRNMRGHSVLFVFSKDIPETDKSCIFLKDNRCSIYNTRPDTCKRYPKGLLDSMCPGIKRETITKEDRDIESKIAKERSIENRVIFTNREMLSTVISRAKQRTDYNQIKMLVGGN